MKEKIKSMLVCVLAVIVIIILIFLMTKNIDKSIEMNQNVSFLFKKIEKQFVCCYN